MSSEDSLFRPIFVPDELREAVSARAWLQAMLDAERALAAASGVDGVAEACDASLYDLAAIAEEARGPGNPVEPLVRALRERSGGADAHRGATSQDVLDTAAMLVARNARALVIRELEAAADGCARMAEQHRATVMPARTLLQQAVPTTFGLKSAGWLVALLDARQTLLAWTPVAELGGAAGTLALLGDRGLDVLAAFARELGLAEPELPWHASRRPVHELVAACDGVASACTKIGLDLVLLAQTEVAEIRVRDGVSSTMPHKRNPVAAVLARACALRVHALAGTFVGEHEHERAAGAWHAEWEALSDVLALTGGAAFHVSRALDGLEVDVERMRENLRVETVSEAGRDVAPEEYLGAAAAFVERALARFRADVG
ncbi:MAG TPA: lyase family protein [Gaiellaceae bacterium]|nr:lyase family protein [Gaiellaceae bacterium]